MHGRWSTRAVARVGAGVAALAVVGLSASPAFAATDVSGQWVGSSAQPDGHLSVVFGATGLSAKDSIDPASVQVTIDGQAVPSTATPITGSANAPTRTTLLVMDVSGSMAAGKTADGVVRLAAAKQAATTYLAAVPDDIKVGLVTFGDTAQVVVEPTLDHRAVARTVSGLTATGSTRLYDAVILADRTLGTTGVRNQLIISDGKDEGSTVGAAAAITSVTSSKVLVDAVSLAATTAESTTLSLITRAGNGKTVLTDQASTLTSSFAAAAQAQASQVVIDVTVPASVAGTTKTVVVGAKAGAQIIGADAAVFLPAAPTGGPTDAPASYGPQPVASTTPGITTRSWFLPVAVGAVAVGLFGLLAVAFLSTDRENQTTGRVRRRLSRYSLTSRNESAAPAVPTSGALGQSQVARSAVELAGRVVQRGDLDTGLGAKLEAAGVPLRPAEWMIIHVGIAIGTALVLTLLSGFSPLATILGLVLGLTVPYVYLAFKETRRKSRFAQQLPDTLQLIAGSLAAGYSLPQAVDTVVRESDGPMAAELNRALVEARLGVPMEDALDTAARRMDSVDFAWVVMAIRIQREVGGNLAEVLTNVAATMRERERLRRQVSVLSAEGRLSAIILGALPLLFVTYLVLVRPEYISVLITSPIGIVMIVVGVVLLIGGSFWLRKVVTVEV